MNPRGSTLAHRLRLIRLQWFGVHGVPELARQLRLPTRTYLNYESGVTVPGVVVLRLIDLTGVRSRWLLDGRGPMYHHRPEPREIPPCDLDEGGQLL
jgi:hypothetical protein